jgi:hypothetical protein
MRQPVLTGRPQLRACGTHARRQTVELARPVDGCCTISGGAVTTGPCTGVEISVPGRQDCSQSEIPFTGAPISLSAPLHSFPLCASPNSTLKLSRPGFGPALKRLGRTVPARRHGGCKSMPRRGPQSRQPPCRYSRRRAATGRAA